MEFVLVGVGILLLLGIGLVFVRLQKITGGGENGSSERLEKLLREQMRENRDELGVSLKNSNDSLDKRMASLGKAQAESLAILGERIEKRLGAIQTNNEQQLEKMRATVDEKLQSTLEKRLGESFKLVSERLEQVHKGLGEMQGLASDVSDFKRVLTNVKTRGTWGEVQLESLLEQVFIKDHYDKQVMLSASSRDAVDFAIKLPDKSSDKGFIYLPIDAKFPLEDYQRLVHAQEKGDVAAVDQASKAMVTRVKLEAKSIKEKYIQPPRTTDFAVLYVPTEGLYAEVLRSPGLFEHLQREFRVTVAGPTTIAAILSSYQLGFRTLAIAEQTGKVWELLTTIKGEFGKFGDLLDKTQEKLQQASRTIEDASRKSRTIESKLGKVQQLADKTTKTAEQTALLETIEG
jgi:DNA recombination protein RmuC